MLTTTDRISPSDQARSASLELTVPVNCIDKLSGPGRSGRVSGDREAQRYLHVCFRSADGPQDASLHYLMFDFMTTLPYLRHLPPYGAGSRAHRETLDVDGGRVRTEAKEHEALRDNSGQFLCSLPRTLKNSWVI